MFYIILLKPKSYFSALKCTAKMLTKDDYSVKNICKVIEQRGFTNISVKTINKKNWIGSTYSCLMGIIWTFDPCENEPSKIQLQTQKISLLPSYGNWWPDALGNKTIFFFFKSKKSWKLRIVTLSHYKLKKKNLDLRLLFIIYKGCCLPLPLSS